MDLLGLLLKDLSRLAGKWLIDWLARFRPLRAITLRRYRRRLARMYGTFGSKSGPVGHRLPMAELYLPLRVELGGRRMSIAEALPTHRRVIVTGDPGTGKTMLLRHLAYEFAERGDGPIPALIELYRIEEARVDLSRCVVEQLSREGFFRADRFVERALDNGTLRVLLDGLDEVSDAHRNAVVRRILDFIARYPECEVVVTCRAAVREPALFLEMSQVAIAELDDQLIGQYVRTRLRIAHGSADVLLRELLDNPRVLSLARVPLLLDMMITMYFDGGPASLARLPASRARFYGQAVDFLLTPWRAEHAANPDRVDDMRQVLRDLAVANLDDPSSDRLVVGRDRAMTIVEATPGTGPARELLAGIIERTGLLHRVDGGYRFAHLSFQEFLAAEALRDDADGLLRRFRSDPGRWLEPVVLWCACAPDATDVVATLLADHSPTALTCLSEVEAIDEELVRCVVETFAENLTDADVIRGFGAAASSAGPVAAIVLSFLEHEVVHGRTTQRRADAANALAASNVPAAAVFLGARSSDTPEAREALERMRDFAVDVLARAVRHDDVTALDSLVAIGTPAAAHALISLLWHQDEYTMACAAWRLATMLPDQRIAQSLASYSLDAAQKTSPDYQWVWQPFTEDPISRTIVSRICQLLVHGPDTAVTRPDPPIDARIAAALGLVGGRPLRVDPDTLADTTTGRQLLSVLKRLGKISGEDLTEKVQPAHQALTDREDPDWQKLQRQYLDLLFRHLDWPQRKQLILAHLPTDYLAYLLGHLKDRAPSQKDWRRMEAQQPGPSYRALMCWAAASIAFAAQIILTWLQAGQSGSAIAAALRWEIHRLADIAGIGGQLWYLITHDSMFGISIMDFHISGNLILLVIIVFALTKIKTLGVIAGTTAAVIVVVVAGTAVLTALALLLTMPTVWMHDITGTWWTILITVPALLALPTVIAHTTRRRRAWFRNPFNGKHSPLLAATTPA